MINLFDIPFTGNPRFKKEFVSPTRDQIHHVFLSPLNIKRVDAQITTPRTL